MKIPGTIVLVSLGAWRLCAADLGQPPTNVVVISTDFINRLVAEARTNHPAVRAADSRVRAAELNAGAVRTWEDPMMMVGGAVFSEKGPRAEDEGNLAYGVEQKLPLWSRPKLERKAADAERAMREAEWNFRVARLRHEITQGLLMTALAEQIVEIGEQDLAWLETTARAIDARYRAGQATLADALQIENEVARWRDALLTDQRRLGHERFSLNRLLNREATAPWLRLRLPPVAPAVPLSHKLLALALENEPKLKVLSREIQQAAASAELTRIMRRPDVSFGVQGQQYSGDGGFRAGMFTLRFSLPWGNADKYRKDYERDREKQRSAEQEREDQVLAVREELHHLAVQIEAMRREALLHSGEITTRAGQMLASRLSEWQAGRGAFRDVLDARRALFESQLMAARATAEEYRLLSEMLLWSGLGTLESLLPLANETPLLPGHENQKITP